MRDRDVRQAIKDMLDDTNQFNEVSLRALPEDIGVAAGQLAFVLIQPVSDKQEDRWDGGEFTGMVNNATISITCMVRNSDPQLCDEACELLRNVVIDTIQGKSLADITVPDHTRYVGTVWQARKPPERRIVMTFVYETIMDSWDGYDEEGDA